MNIFKDEVYEKMDWLEKACVPVICKLNDVLNSLPDEIVLDYDFIVKEGFRYGPGRIEVDCVLNNAETYHHLLKKLPYDDKSRIYKCFDLKIEGSPVLNLLEHTLKGGTIKLVKTKEAFEEKEIQALIGEQGIRNHLNNIDHKDVPVERLNEILELLGLHEARRNRSSKQKLDSLVERMREIMTKNEWDIRDVELSNRIPEWIREYLKDGSLPAYMNFCKLKVMTHNEEPIYSIEGEESV